MIRILIAFFVLVPVFGQETVDLDTPVQVQPGVSKFRPGEFAISLRRNVISIVFYEIDGAGNFIQDGRSIPCVWNESQGAVLLIRALNKANLSTKSLLRRIMERAQTDGCLGTGTITGTPE